MEARLNTFENGPRVHFLIVFIWNVRGSWTLRIAAPYKSHIELEFELESVYCWWTQAAMESLVSGAICGITYHMFAGQPLTVIGSTGPVLVFETIVYKFCK